MDEARTATRGSLEDWLQAKAHEAERNMKHNPLSSSYYEGMMHAYNEAWREIQRRKEDDSEVQP